MIASIKKVAIVMLSLPFCHMEGHADGRATGQSKINRSIPAIDVPTWESLKPKNETFQPSSEGRKQVSPIDPTQPVITPRPRNKVPLPKGGIDGMMFKQQVAPIDHTQHIFIPHPTKGKKQIN